jgi:hypothetical protein
MTVALLPLAKCLAGTFNNIPQALAEPAWYVQFRLWIRPVPQLSTPTAITFFLEQASTAYRAHLRSLELSGNLERTLLYCNPHGLFQ